MFVSLNNNNNNNKKKKGMIMIPEFEFIFDYLFKTLLFSVNVYAGL